MKTKEKETWMVDQVAKSGFFHHKLHEWELLETAYELESIKGEELEWVLERLNISAKAWNKVIHRGIKPVMVFAHPDLLKENPKRIRYYRMLSMVSQKSMARVGLNISGYEVGKILLQDDLALNISRHLNRIISLLVEQDERIDSREFDLWRGMAAGTQAQGSWQNAKGDKAEILIKSLIERRVYQKKSVSEEVPRGRRKALRLKDGRVIELGDEPDIGVYKDDLILAALEIKGGIDPAGVLERFGAALKSLRRAKQENPNSVTILIMQEVSLTATAKGEIDKSKTVIDHTFTIEDIIGDENVRNQLFEIMGI